MKKVLIFSVCAILISACASRGPTAEQQAEFTAKNNQLLAARDSGKITWSQWATEANSEFVKLHGQPSPQLNAILSHRIYVASEVDAKRITPQQGVYLISQKVSDEATAQEQRANARRAAAAASDPVTCSRIGNSVTCF